MAHDSPPPTGTLYWLQTILRDPRLNPTETLLLVALADHVGADDRAWPSVRRLASAARCSPRTARRHLESLETKGAIERNRRRREDGSHSTYEYRLSREWFGLGQSDQGVGHIDLGVGTSSDQGVGRPGGRAEVPNEPPIEPAASASCARGCVEGWVSKLDDEGYSVIGPCGCRLEQSA